MKRIAVLTSGGDAPGMNAAIRAVVRTALFNNVEIIGINRGYSGAIKGDFRVLDLGSVGDIIHRGGTILQTARSEEFKTEEGRKAALQNMRQAGIQGLVAIGGDGTFRGALALHQLGFPVVGVPGTIDNDIAGTDHTIGFDTTINTVLDAINKIRDTASSHGRIFIIEVMGRNSGFIALAAGLAGGAESIFIPEKPLNIQSAVENIKRGNRRGKKHNIIILAEGVASGTEVARQIEELSGFETKLSVLGYIQRGGTPTAFDRLLASRLGAEAVNRILQGESGIMVGTCGEEVKTASLEWALQQTKAINLRDYDLAGILGI